MAQALAPCANAHRHTAAPRHARPDACAAGLTHRAVCPQATPADGHAAINVGFAASISLNRPTAVGRVLPSSLANSKRDSRRTDRWMLVRGRLYNRAHAELVVGRDRAGSLGRHHLHRLDLPQRCLRRALCIPQVAGRLHRQPDTRSTTMLDAKPALETQCHFGRNGGLAIQYPRQRGPRDAKLHSRVVDAQSRRREHVIAKVSPGCGGLCMLLI